MNYIILWYLSWSLEQMRILWIKASEELKPQRAEIFFSLSNLNFALDEARSVEKADLKPHQADARLWNSLIFSDPKLKSITLKLMAKIPFSICQFPDDFGRGEPLVVIGIGERYLKDAKNIIQNPNVKCETKLQGVEGLKDRLAPINLGPRSSHVHPHVILVSTAQNAKYNTIQIHPHPIITTTSTNAVLVKDLTYLHHCNALRHGWAPFPRLLKCVASLGLGIASKGGGCKGLPGWFSVLFSHVAWRVVWACHDGMGQFFPRFPVW